MRHSFVAAAAFLVASHASWADDMHSVDTIQRALAMPIPSEILQNARQVDAQINGSRTFNGQAVELVNDARYARAVQIVERLSKGNLNGGVPHWNVRVLDTNPKTVNAFTVGGNYIYIFTGLLEGVQSDDELAVVIGHEMSHALLKHVFRRSQDSGNLAATLIEAVGGLSKNANSRQTASLIGGTIKGAYSREDEREADALGAYLASQAGYDSSRAIDFFKRQLEMENELTAKNQQQMASAKQTIETQVAYCNNLTTQWNTQPQVRTPQNAARVQSVCSTAKANAERFNQTSRQNGTAQVTSILTQTHPVDSERINSIAAESAFLKGERPLQSLAGIGQGYNVLVAINANPIAQSNVSSDSPSGLAGPVAATVCEAKAVSKDGKPLAGAAKNAFMKKCEADAKAAK